MTAVKLPETDLARIAKYCATRVPAHVLKDVRVEFSVYLDTPRCSPPRCEGCCLMQ